MKKHVVKTWPEFFEPQWFGLKSFEVRLNDRDYKAGDILDQLEYVPDKNSYTGRKIVSQIIYCLYDFEGVKDGYVVMQLKELGRSG